MNCLDDEMKRLYGESTLIHLFRYGAFAVHKDLQRKGLGRYMHERNIKEVRPCRSALQEIAERVVG
jgi:GNAT superfamily N-acetyltransferase